MITETVITLNIQPSDRMTCAMVIHSHRSPPVNDNYAADKLVEVFCMPIAFFTSLGKKMQKPHCTMRNGTVITAMIQDKKLEGKGKGLPEEFLSRVFLWYQLRFRDNIVKV